MTPRDQEGRSLAPVIDAMKAWGEGYQALVAQGKAHGIYK